jgi:hypothetical protein
LFATDILISKEIEPLTPLQVQGLNRSMVNRSTVSPRGILDAARTVSDVLCVRCWPLRSR